MKTYQGIVKNKTDTKWNGKTLWSFQIEGENFWFRTGETPLPRENGDLIAFEANPINKQVNVASVRDGTTESSPAPTTSPRTAASQPSQSDDRQSYWKNRERLDSVRMARADATRVVCAALANDSLPHPASTGKGKRLPLIVGYIKELTQEFIEYEQQERKESEAESGD